MHFQIMHCGNFATNRGHFDLFFLGTERTENGDEMAGQIKGEGNRERNFMAYN